MHGRHLGAQASVSAGIWEHSDDTQITPAT